MSRSAKAKLKNVEKMPRKYQASLAMYLCGIDLRSTFSKVSYYKHKSALKKYGYDISRQVKADYLPPSENLDLCLHEYR